MRKLQGFEYIRLLKTCGSRRRMISSDKSISIDLKHAMKAELYVGALLGTNYQQMYVDLWIDALVKEVQSKCK
ncbi:hypothetical protein BvCmsB5655_03590 [Escherichia coli]|nr:hypothetical protein BvCmsB5655_03590 [Escherichia coli]